MNKHKKFIKECYDEKYASMCIEWKAIIEKQYPEFKEEEFKEGDWLIAFDLGCIVKFKEKSEMEHRFNSSEIYGFALKGHTGWITSKFRKATKEEIESHLIEEAKRRGFKKGILFIDTSGKTRNTHYSPSNSSDVFFYRNGPDPFKYNMALCKHGGCIYDNGKWAEIIPTMTKEKAEEKLNCKIV